MGIDYDAWLEQPYQEQYALEALYENAADIYAEGEYESDLDAWLAENPDKDEQDFQQTEFYNSVLDGIVEDMRNE